MFHLRKSKSEADRSAESGRTIIGNSRYGNLGGNFVLIVSDEIDGFLSRLVQILETQGFITQTVRNPRETLSLFVNKVPAVVLIDYDTEVKWIMKSTFQMLTIRPKARVIVLLSEPMVIREADRIGVELFFNRQEDLEKLVRTIRSIFGLRKQMTTWVER